MQANDQYVEPLTRGQNSRKGTETGSDVRGEGGDEVVDDPVHAEARGHVEREVAHHEGQELEDPLRLSRGVVRLLLHHHTTTRPQMESQRQAEKASQQNREVPTQNPTGS